MFAPRNYVTFSMCRHLNVMPQPELPIRGYSYTCIWHNPRREKPPTAGKLEKWRVRENFDGWQDKMQNFGKNGVA